MAMSLAIGDGPPIGGDGVTKQKAVVEKYDEVGFHRHCVEIVTQTSLLTDHLAGADLTVPVPTCPGWNVSQLHAMSTAASAGRATSSRRGPCSRGAAGDFDRCGAGCADVVLRRREAAQRPMPVASPTRPRCTGPTRHWRSEWSTRSTPTSRRTRSMSGWNWARRAGGRRDPGTGRGPAIGDLPPPPHQRSGDHRRRDARRLLVGASRFRLRLSDRGRRPRAGMRTTPGSARRPWPSATPVVVR